MAGAAWPCIEAEFPAVHRLLKLEVMVRQAACVLLLLAPALLAGEDNGPDLLAAAKKGQTEKVAALLAKGANVETADKNGRTPLMLAAQKGHAETVKLLLAKGAKAEARDRDGWTAFGLAVIEDQDTVVALLPKPKPLSVFLDVTWAPENLYSSCFMNPEQLAEHVGGLHPEALVSSAIREYAAFHGKGLVEFAASEPADAVAHVRVRPAVSCLPQKREDNVSLAIDVRMVRSRNQAPMLEKTFGGGLKGLHARSVTSPAQYASLLGDWAKSHAGPIYSAILEAWLRGEQ
jgi:Ankyrin repeats (3 copies)